MTPQAQEFGLQYSLLKPRLQGLAEALESALHEDLRENADMFDRERSGFSTLTANLHPNGTQRSLEKQLCDEPQELLLYFLALLEVGRDATEGLADLDSPAAFAEACADTLATLTRREQSSKTLAYLITLPKAELSLKRLRFALQKLAPFDPF